VRRKRLGHGQDTFDRPQAAVQGEFRGKPIFLKQSRLDLFGSRQNPHGDREIIESAFLFDVRRGQTDCDLVRRVAKTAVFYPGTDAFLAFFDG
jgi:hypothetical protein